ncbi:nucleotidyltransferase domain-containing protein [Longimicrobium terrae]|uniref:Polymerase nucleotidyl transferase domain-containing protein n=1 Tax=Longimicrobium terrae TaxID=1639882 RepID=A0A841GZ07_9BACT|nr:nucleotidyltransferase domain-containing protein [Longimicrobium terrae]MBB4636528.1 hypothetical protein [Longimicrobium terrae]MBB6070948.1 hypothetical protein [Longimicrobium terrae]NNC28970.1 nucleotidyltransferase domain-containing protein [Longimicrobium terrae]
MSEQLALPVQPRSPVLELRDALEADWPHILAARERAARMYERVQILSYPFVPRDTSLVLFGSLARAEFTHGSDVDWTLLVDGPADPDHWDLTQRLRSKFTAARIKPPSPGGPFGRLTFSHDLIHRIGGDNDTNQNTTQRLLLLLESRPTSNRDAYDRVIANVLTRYVEEDLLGPAESPFRVPRFLLNDFARYWRTMAVDFAHKRRERQADQWAVRTTKLRFSRKLLHTAGLLSCFLCREAFKEEKSVARFHDAKLVVDYLARLLGTTPLDIVARVVLDYFGKDSGAANRLFGAYDSFLGLLDDEDKRERLKNLSPGDADSDPLYREASALGKAFQDALGEIFFSEPLRDFTIRYGVF